MSTLEPLGTAIEQGDRAEAEQLTEQAIEAGTDPQQVLDALVGAMDEVGRRFQENEIFVPEMLIASRAMKQCLSRLEPLLVERGITPAFTAIIGTVQGDLHDIGKNLVAMMWRGANFNVVDLGTNVAPDQFVSAAREHNANVVGLSALLTTTMPAMKQTVEALKADSNCNACVVVGGAPVTEAFARDIGADGFAPDAGAAVQLVRKLVEAA